MTERERIPRELIFGNPERALPRVSPDAARLAYLAPDEGVLNLWCGPRDGPARPVTKDRGRGIRSYFWAEDGRHLLYAQDRDGDENWHLYQAGAGPYGKGPGTAEPNSSFGGVDTEAVRDLTPFPGVQAQLVATDPHRPHELLLALNKRDPRAHDVYRCDLRTGALELAAENPGDFVGWLADGSLEPRAARRVRDDGGAELLVRDSPGGAWRTFLSWGPDDEGGAHGFAADGRSLYISSSEDADTTGLFEMSLDGKTRRLLARRDGADVAAVLLHPTDYHAEAVAFCADRLDWRVLDERLAADFERLREACAGDMSILSRDNADTTWVVMENCDTRPPRFHVYDRREKKIRPLFSSRPSLERHMLAPMRPARVRARDGLSLPCYLTLPVGLKPRELPLVLLVHGGPWARDHWGFSAEAQWIADQGYAALQVNFRGSTGFGKRHLHAGDREWGAKMQDDLSDAVRWAVAQGLADPRRVAIFGASYGGYAALAGAAFTPELYCCAVDIVGPSNIATLVRSIPPYWEPLRRLFDTRVGNVDTEEQFLRSRSPLFAAERIRIPLLIAQGANDPRVKQAESEQIVAALKERGRPVEYLLFPDEGHGFVKPENRLRFYEAAERFLARHLAAREAENRA